MQTNMTRGAMDEHVRFQIPLPDSQTRYGRPAGALDLIDQGITLVDNDLRLVAWNNCFLRLLDFRPRWRTREPLASFIRC